MSVRTWMAGATVALVAVLGLAVVAGGSAAPAKTEATPLKVAVVTDTGGLNDKGFNALAYNGLKVAQRQYGVQGRVFISKSAADYIPNLSTAASPGLRPRDRGRLPHGRRDRRRREEVPEDEVRDHRRPGGRPEGQAEERARHHRSRRRRRAASPASQRRRSRSRARSRRSAASRSPRSTRSSPATSTAPRRSSRASRRSTRYSQDFVDSGQVQGNRPEPDRPGLGRRLPGRRRVRPRRPHGGEGLERLGHRRRQRPELPRHAHPHERARRRSMRASRRRSS